MDGPNLSDNRSYFLLIIICNLQYVSFNEDLLTCYVVASLEYIVSMALNYSLVVTSDPRFGLACLGKVNMAYENDQDLMIHFYGFVAK